VGRSHGSSTDGVGGSGGSDPSGSDKSTRGEDVNTLSVVGEVASSVELVGEIQIIDLSSSNRDGRSLRSGGIVASISIVVSSGNSEGNSGFHCGSNSVVAGLAVGTSERHVGNSRSRLGVGNELDSLDDSSVGSRSRASQDLNGNEGDFLGNSIGSSSDGSGDVSSVSVAIVVDSVSDVVGSPSDSSGEFLVSDQNTGVDDESGDSSSGVGVFVIPREENFSLRDSVQSPSGLLLDGASLRDMDNAILLDVIHMSSSNGGRKLARIHSGSKSLEILTNGIIGVNIGVEPINVAEPLCFGNVLVEDYDVVLGGASGCDAENQSEEEE